MTLAELQQALRSVEPAAVLVSPRMLENIIRQAGNMPGFLWSVPHRKSLITDRQTLFRHVEQEELTLGPDQLLPQTVMLLAWPEAEELEGADRGRAVAQLLATALPRLGPPAPGKPVGGRETDGDGHPRAHRAVGPARLEEIRTVLVQDHYLAPNPDERSLYIEFAAVFLELKYFAPHLLARLFPDHSAISTRSPSCSARTWRRGPVPCARARGGATESAPRTASSSQEAHEYYWKLVRSSDRAAQQGNIVLAAIQRSARRRGCRGALGLRHRVKKPSPSLLGLVDRLQKVLALSAAEAEEWRKHLPMLLDKADQGRRAVEAALLYDLQKVCLDHEHEIYSLDLVEWLMSGGKRPIKRPLPSQQQCASREPCAARTQRLTMARLSDEDRSQFAVLLQEAVHAQRGSDAPALSPLADLRPARRGPETAPSAGSDCLSQGGRGIAGPHHRLGLRDFQRTARYPVAQPAEAARPERPAGLHPRRSLLRLDRRLTTLLDGVYRPSEFYLRWLERLTALNFGTPARAGC